MSFETEVTQIPKWLNELEEKREKRLKAKLGHEHGAGAACLNCGDKCPGLDLHFWRKICKNCKCSKEKHEVPDDDIYGWTQDELLGRKLSKTRKKIVFPGKKDEVELEWTPSGTNETVDKYLSTLPADLLPIKGSQAASNRKQLLKEQIPIHDFDPTLCHTLTDSELQQMYEYVVHLKKNSVGVGHLVQIGRNKGISHSFDKSEEKVIVERTPKGTVQVENIALHGEMAQQLKQNAKNLAHNPGLMELYPRNLGSREIIDMLPLPCDLKDKNYLPNNFNPKLKNYKASDDMNPYAKENCGHVDQLNLNYNFEPPRELPYPSHFIQKQTGLQTGLHPDVTEQNPLIYGFKNLELGNSTNQDYYPEKVLFDNSRMFRPIKTEELSSSELRGHKSPLYNQHGDPYGAPRLSEYNTENVDVTRDNFLQKPVNAISPNRFNNYGFAANIIPGHSPLGEGCGLEPAYSMEGRTTEKHNLPHLRPNQIDLLNENCDPVPIRNIRDVAYPTYNHENQFNFNPSNNNIFNHHASYPDVQNEIKNFKNKNPLPSFAPANYSIWENKQDPHQTIVGAINDIVYEENVPQYAMQKSNFMEGNPPSRIPIDHLSDAGVIPVCHACKNAFKLDEVAIAISERSDAVYHTQCFKCSGCNQMLADMFYFFDKISNNVYCGRDFAKIQGIPRCQACDELIFRKEYCLAQDSTFHVEHFCCFECDTPLANQNYVIENLQPVCLPCEQRKANKCFKCSIMIQPNEQALQLKDDIHFHASDECFACTMCQKPLLNEKLLFRNNYLYCSHECYNCCG